MNVRELYAFFNEKIPPSLSCEWDNDGLMCCPEPEREVRRVLVALDMTAAVVQRAVDGNYDAVISHHPLIFSPLRAVETGDPVARKVIHLLRAGITAMSFHTRLDAVKGGVNDVLASRLGLIGMEPFGEQGEEIGRIGTLPQPMAAPDFAALVKAELGADSVVFSDAGKPVQRVAVLGGSGSDDVKAAVRAGADSYLSGELKHNWLTEAPERGINLFAAGHFHTEHPICERLREWVLEADSHITVEVVNSNPTKVI